MAEEKILLIDDEEVNVRVLSMSLRVDGYEVVTAYSGEEGLEVFDRESPDIVLTDIKMPGMDGLEVLRRIKERRPEAEVIIITGHGDIDSAIEALQYGASDFINKPIRDEALAISLKRARDKLDIRRQLKAYTDDLENMVRIATEEVHRKSSFQAKLIKSSNDGIVATDDEWKIVIFNPGAERIFGYKKFEVVRKSDIHELFPPDVVRIFENDSGEQKDSGWMETTVVSKDGEEIPVRFSGTVLHEKGKMMGSVAFFQDLREIKRLQRELIHSERLAAVGQTVAGMAHCIKNILHGFKGGTYLVDIGLDKNDMDKLKTGWKMVQRNIDRTSELVLDLLSYSKEREPEYQICSPNEIAADVCDLLQQTAAENEVELVTELDPSIGEVSMDGKSVHRALMNLVSNGIDACVMDEDLSKRHRVIVRTALEGDNVICFQVADTGCGMTDEVKSRLFTSFFSTKGAKGTGLGLLVTRKLIEEHKGSIDVDSEQGRGTTFTVKLPVGKTEEAQSEGRESI
jgi:PAS domain S-box-containing protein